MTNEYWHVTALTACITRLRKFILIAAVCSSCVFCCFATSYNLLGHLACVVLSAAKHAKEEVSIAQKIAKDEAKEAVQAAEKAASAAKDAMVQAKKAQVQSSYARGDDADMLINGRSASVTSVLPSEVRMCVFVCM